MSGYKKQEWSVQLPPSVLHYYGKDGDLVAVEIPAQEMRVYFTVELRCTQCLETLWENGLTLPDSDDCNKCMSQWDKV